MPKRAPNGTDYVVPYFLDPDFYQKINKLKTLAYRARGARRPDQRSRSSPAAEKAVTRPGSARPRSSWHAPSGPAEPGFTGGPARNCCPRVLEAGDAGCKTQHGITEFLARSTPSRMPWQRSHIASAAVITPSWVVAGTVPFLTDNGTVSPGRAILHP